MPSSAASNLPGLAWTAPVNAPRSKPNSSDSSRSVRQRRAVDLDEGLVAAHRVPAQAARDQLLAGAGLTADQDGDVRVGDTLDQRPDRGHLLARAEEQRLERRRPGVAGAGRQRGTMLQRSGERRLQLAAVERPRNQRRGRRALLEDREQLPVGDHDDRHVAVDLAEGRQDVDGRPARDVEDDRAGSAVLEARHRLVGADGERTIAPAGEKTAEHVTGGAFTFDDEDVFGSFLGRGPHAYHLCVALLDC